MKLLKIGSSPSCDIVLNSNYVSSHHADLTLLDNGDILIEDKGSTNGTMIGSKKILPHQEVNVHRGDLVKFADVELVWARVPSLGNNSKYKQIINIGSNFRNDIVVNNGTVSRYHACLKISANGRAAFLVDNNSKNGTQINGVKIQRNQPVRVKKGDNVMCGSEDVTDQLKEFIPSIFPVWAWGAIATTAIAAVICAFMFIMPGDMGEKMKSLFNSPVNPADYRSSVVYVSAAYHYEVSLEDNPLPENIILRSEVYRYQATAFFIDQEGRMATNRHVALPWSEDYREKEVTEQLIQNYEEYFANQLQISRLNDDFADDIVKAVERLKKTEVGLSLLQMCSNKDELNARIARIQKSKLKIQGVMDYISVGYPGQFFTHIDEFQRCHVMCESSSKEKDLAILQLNDKKTPTSVKRVFNPRTAIVKNLVPLKDKLYTIGYPAGLLMNLDFESKSLEPTIRDTKCSKMPSRFGFEIESSTIGGSSGSPVFNEKGQLVGVLNSTVNGQDITYGVHARFLKEMYEAEVNALNEN